MRGSRGTDEGCEPDRCSTDWCGARDAGGSVATDATADVFVAGHTGGGLDGNTSAGGFDLFVMKYGPDGRKR